MDYTALTLDAAWKTAASSDAAFQQSLAETQDFYKLAISTIDEESETAKTDKAMMESLMNRDIQNITLDHRKTFFTSQGVGEDLLAAYDDGKDPLHKVAVALMPAFGVVNPETNSLDVSRSNQVSAIWDKFSSTDDKGVPFGESFLSLYGNMSSHAVSTIVSTIDHAGGYGTTKAVETIYNAAKYRRDQNPEISNEELFSSTVGWVKNTKEYLMNTYGPSWATGKYARGAEDQNVNQIVNGTLLSFLSEATDARRQSHGVVPQDDIFGSMTNTRYATTIADGVGTALRLMNAGVNLQGVIDKPIAEEIATRALNSFNGANARPFTKLADMVDLIESSVVAGTPTSVVTPKDPHSGELVAKSGNYLVDRVRESTIRTFMTDFAAHDFSSPQAPSSIPGLVNTWFVDDGNGNRQLTDRGQAVLDQLGVELSNLLPRQLDGSHDVAGKFMALEIMFRLAGDPGGWAATDTINVDQIIRDVIRSKALVKRAGVNGLEPAINRWTEAYLGSGDEQVKGALTQIKAKYGTKAARFVKDPKYMAPISENNLFSVRGLDSPDELVYDTAARLERMLHDGEADDIPQLLSSLDEVEIAWEPALGDQGKSIIGFNARTFSGGESAEKTLTELKGSATKLVSLLDPESPNFREYSTLLLQLQSVQSLDEWNELIEVAGDEIARKRDEALRTQFTEAATLARERAKDQAEKERIPENGYESSTKYGNN